MYTRNTSIILNNLGVSVSLYFLVLFYQITVKELLPYKPLLKFSVIKGIVFFCYWQSVVIMGIVGIGLVPSFRTWDHARIGTTIQNMLICLEMLIFASLHLFAFPYDIYQVGAQSQAPLVHEFELNRGVKGLRKGVKDSINQKDMVHDTFDAYAPGSVKKGQMGRIKQNKFKRADKQKRADGDQMVQNLESSSSDDEIKLDEEDEDSIENLKEDNKKIKKTARR